jgi:hypothetical protein
MTTEPTEKTVKMASWRARPVVDRDGAIVLYDIYVSAPGSGEEWIGSRRTLEQCRESFNAYFRSVPAQQRS